MKFRPDLFRTDLVEMLIVLLLVVPLAGCERTYTVREVKSYYPHQNENDQLYLIVYETGNSGFVKEVFCELPPMSNIVDIKKITVKGKARDWIMSDPSYFCERLE